MTVVLYKSSSNKNRLQASQQNIFESDYRYINTFHLHDFVKFCLCISLHVCVLVWLYHVGSLKRVVCVCVYAWMCLCVCVFVRRSRSRVFLPCFGFWEKKLKKKKKKWNRSYLPPNRSTELRSEKSCQKIRPQLPFPLYLPLSGDFHRCTLCQGLPSSPSSSSLFIGLAFFFFRLMLITFDASCLLIWPVTGERKHPPHYSATCLSRLSVFS